MDAPIRNVGRQKYEFLPPDLTSPPLQICAESAAQRARHGAVRAIGAQQLTPDGPQILPRAEKIPIKVKKKKIELDENFNYNRKTISKFTPDKYIKSFKGTLELC